MRRTGRRAWRIEAVQAAVRLHRCLLRPERRMQIWKSLHNLRPLFEQVRHHNLQLCSGEAIPADVASRQESAIPNLEVVILHPRQHSHHTQSAMHAQRTSLVKGDIARV